MGDAEYITGSGSFRQPSPIDHGTLFTGLGIFRRILDSVTNLEIPGVYLGQHLQGVVQRVVVLLDEVMGLVADGARKVADEEPVLVPDLPVFL